MFILAARCVEVVHGPEEQVDELLELMLLNMLVSIFIELFVLLLLLLLTLAPCSPSFVYTVLPWFHLLVHLEPEDALAETFQFSLHYQPVSGFQPPCGTTSNHTILKK